MGAVGSETTIVATSDLHGFLDGIEKTCIDNQADILVIAGDIEPADIFADKDAWFLNDFVCLIKNLAKMNVEVVAIEGNHDFWLRAKSNQLKKYELTNFHLLRDSGITVKGISFYGTPWVPVINWGWCYEGYDSNNASRYIAMPKHTDILITHSPPLIPDAHIDESIAYDKRYWKHFGSQALYNAIMRKVPKLNFCGHIHSGDHNRHIIKTPKGDCYCYNVSRINERYLIEYPFRVIKLFNGQILEVSSQCKSLTNKKKK